MSKNRKGSLDDIPNSSTLPDGDYLLEIEEFEERRTKDTSKVPNALMYNVDYVVLEPEDFAGRHYFENYLVGTREDPEADDPKTWKKSISARILKLHMQRAGVETAGKTVEEAAPEFKGRKIGLSIVGFESDDGTPRNKIKKAMSPGEFTPCLHGDVGSGAGAAAAVAAAAGGRKRERSDDNDEEPAPAPTPEKSAPAEEKPAEEKPASGKKRGSTKQYRCRECDDKFTDKQEYYDHLASHDEED